LIRCTKIKTQLHGDIENVNNNEHNNEKVPDNFKSTFWLNNWYGLG